MEICRLDIWVVSEQSDVMATLFLPLRHAAVDVDGAADLEEDCPFLVLLVVAVDV